MPVPKSASKNQKAISVYVTGFGPFRNVQVNPSYEIVSRLANTTLTFTTPNATYNVTFIVYPEPVPVIYRTVASTVTQIWDAGGFDYMIHVGQGHNGPYELETCASEFGYRKLDNNGENPENEKGLDTASVKGQDLRSGAYGQLFETGLDVDWIVDFVRKGDVRNGTKGETAEMDRSDNAGLFLCEYIYSRSLMEAKKRGLEKAKVLFMHVCADGKPYSIETGVQVLKRVVEGAVRNGETS